MNSGEEISCEFVISRGDCPEMFEFVEEAFDEIALAIKREVARAWDFAVGLGGNHGGDVSPGRAGASRQRGFRGHRRAHGFWGSVRGGIARWLVRRFFSRAGAMLVSAHDGGVDHHVFVVVIARQQRENTVENPPLRPPAEALVGDLPIAETLWKIPPRDAGSKSIQNRFNEQ